jgi:hypothetical protein
MDRDLPPLAAVTVNLLTPDAIASYNVCFRGRYDPNSALTVRVPATQPQQVQVREPWSEQDANERNPNSRVQRTNHVTGSNRRPNMERVEPIDVPSMEAVQRPGPNGLLDPPI